MNKRSVIGVGAVHSANRFFTEILFYDLRHEIIDSLVICNTVSGALIMPTLPER